MIHREEITFCAYGKRLFRSKVSAPFSDAHDPGSIGMYAPHKVEPLPYGSANFDVPEMEEGKIVWIHRLVAPLLPSLKEAGADDFWLHITYHCDSGAIGFSKEELKMIVDLDCDFSIDFVVDEERDNKGYSGGEERDSDLPQVEHRLQQ
jgi:hypothetical protein